MDHVTKKEFNDAMRSVDQRFDYLEFDLKSFKDEVKEGFARMDKRFDQIFALFDRDNKETDILAAEVASAHVRIDRVEGHLGLAM